MRDLTVIIPSFNRLKDLKRQIPFWSETDAKVIILDGSKIPLKTNDRLPLNISYYHLPIPLTQRLVFSNSLIKTKFVIMLCDDEIYLHSSLNASIDFLKKNPDYSSCKGLCIGFRRNYFSSRLEGVPNYTELHNYVINSDDPFERVIKHFSPYTVASIYAIHRKEVYDKFTKILSFERVYSAGASWEIQFSIITAMIGKIKVLDQLMWFRNRENSTLSGNDTVHPWIWIRDQQYSKEIKYFIEDFEKIFPNEPEIKNCVRKTLEVYSSGYDKLKKKKLKLFLKKLFFEFWLFMYEPIKCLIRPLIRTNKRFIDVAIELKKTNVKINMTELKSVISFLEKN